MGNSDAVRIHAKKKYSEAARRKGLSSFSINVGEVHRALALQNRVPLVCMALKSKKFLESNRLVLVSTSGPPSGQSTTVTYTYKFIDDEQRPLATGDPWLRLRGSLKDVFAALGGGENYLRTERAQFRAQGEKQ